MKRSAIPPLLVGSSLLAVCLLLGLRPLQQAEPATLGVPLIGQRMSQWCWAAVTEMVTTYYHNVDPKNQLITQCDLVKTTYPNITLDCDRIRMFDSVVNEPGYPFLNVKTYSFGSWNAPGPIPYDTLASELAAGRPVVIQWTYFGVTPGKKSSITRAMGFDYPIGAHFLIAEGLPRSDYSDSLWVSGNDPLPLRHGCHRVISYSAIAGCVPSSHQTDKSAFMLTTVFYGNSGAIYKIQPSQ